MIGKQQFFCCVPKLKKQLGRQFLAENNKSLLLHLQTKWETVQVYWCKKNTCRLSFTWSLLKNGTLVFNIYLFLWFLFLSSSISSFSKYLADIFWEFFELLHLSHSYSLQGMTDSITVMLSFTFFYQSLCLENDEVKIYGITPRWPQMKNLK